MAALHREPLVHFLVLGSLIFGIFFLMDDTPVEGPRARIEVTAADATRLMRQFETTLRRPPSETELSALIDAYIREEVLVREARALSLDRDDPLVRQQLAQRMQFLVESGADAAMPTDADLRVHFAENAERFAVAPLVAFEQLQLDAAHAGKAGTVLAAVRSGSDPGAFAQASPLPRDIPPVSKQVVDSTFGEGFFDRLAKLEVGQWSGPVASAYGPHLVRVTLMEPGHQPRFEDIREEVEKDWRRARAQERYEQMLSRYEINRPNAADVLTAR